MASSSGVRPLADLAGSDALGSGTFGRVVKRNINGTAVAVKIFDHKMDAVCEVVANAAVSPHPGIIQLLDVAAGRHFELIYPLFDSSLREFLAGRSQRPPIRGAAEEVQHLTHILVDAVAHLHAHHVVHTDIKSASVLIKGRGCVSFGDEEDLESFGQRLSQLPVLLQVCLADLGCLEPGDPTQRVIPTREQVAANGVGVTTVHYRAPEVALGDSRFSYPADCWSLGCVLAEIVKREPLFNGWEGELGVIMQIFRLCGTPTEGRLVQLPRFSSAFPKFTSSWPPAWLAEQPQALVDMVTGLLTLGPDDRLSAADAANSSYFRPLSLSVELSGCTERGPATIAQGRLEPNLLEWLQTDPYWIRLASQLGCDHKPLRCRTKTTKPRKCTCTGYVSEEMPACSRCHHMDCSEVLPAKRVVAFARAFRLCNKRWLHQLTEQVRAALRHFPTEFLGHNGLDFFRTCFEETALCYASIEGMRSTAHRAGRHNPAHLEGGDGPHCCTWG